MRPVGQVAQREHRETASWINCGGDHQEPLMASTFVSDVELVAEDTMQQVSRPITERCVDRGKGTSPCSGQMLSTSPSSIAHSRNSGIRRRLARPKWLLLTQGDHPCLRLFGSDTCGAASSGGEHQVATWQRGNVAFLGNQSVSPGQQGSYAWSDDRHGASAHG